MAELTNEEIQDICDKIQAGETSTSPIVWHGVLNRMFMGRWYWHLVHIDGIDYMVDVNRKIIFD